MSIFSLPDTMEGHVPLEDLLGGEPSSSTNDGEGDITVVSAGPGDISCPEDDMCPEDPPPAEPQNGNLNLLPVPSSCHDYDPAVPQDTSTSAVQLSMEANRPPTTDNGEDSSDDALSVSDSSSVCSDSSLDGLADYLNSSQETTGAATSSVHPSVPDSQKLALVETSTHSPVVLACESLLVGLQSNPAPRGTEGVLLDQGSAVEWRASHREGATAVDTHTVDSRHPQEEPVPELMLHVPSTCNFVTDSSISEENDLDDIDIALFLEVDGFLSPLPFSPHRTLQTLSPLPPTPVPRASHHISPPFLSPIALREPTISPLPPTPSRDENSIQQLPAHPNPLPQFADNAPMGLHIPKPFVAVGSSPSRHKLACKQLKLSESSLFSPPFDSADQATLGLSGKRLSVPPSEVAFEATSLELHCQLREGTKQSQDDRKKTAEALSSDSIGMVQEAVTTPTQEMNAETSAKWGEQDSQDDDSSITIPPSAVGSAAIVDPMLTTSKDIAMVVGLFGSDSDAEEGEILGSDGEEEEVFHNSKGNSEIVDKGEEESEILDEGEEETVDSAEEGEVKRADGGEEEVVDNGGEEGEIVDEEEKDEMVDGGQEETVDRREEKGEDVGWGEMETIDSGRADEKETIGSGRADERETIDSGRADERETIDSGRADEEETIDSGRADEKETIDSGRADEKETIDSGRVDEKETIDRREETVDSGGEEKGEIIDKGEETVDSGGEEEGEIIDKGEETVDSGGEEEGEIIDKGEETVDSGGEEEGEIVDKGEETVDSGGEEEGEIVDKGEETVDSGGEEEGEIIDRGDETVDNGGEEEGEIIDRGDETANNAGEETVDSGGEEEVDGRERIVGNHEEGEVVGTVTEEKREVVDSEREEESWAIGNKGEHSTSTGSEGEGSQGTERRSARLQQGRTEDTFSQLIHPAYNLRTGRKKPRGPLSGLPQQSRVGGRRASCEKVSMPPRKKQRMEEPPPCQSPPALEATPENVLPGYRLRSRCVNFWQASPKRRRLSSSESKVPPLNSAHTTIHNYTPPSAAAHTTIHSCIHHLPQLHTPPYAAAHTTFHSCTHHHTQLHTPPYTAAHTTAAHVTSPPYTAAHSPHTTAAHSPHTTAAHSPHTTAAHSPHTTAAHTTIHSCNSTTFSFRILFYSLRQDDSPPPQKVMKVAPPECARDTGNPSEYNPNPLVRTRTNSEKLPVNDVPAAVSEGAETESEELTLDNGPASTSVRDLDMLTLVNNRAVTSVRTRRGSEKLPVDSGAVGTKRSAGKLLLDNRPATTCKKAKKGSVKLPVDSDPAVASVRTRSDSEKLPFSSDPAVASVRTKSDSEKLPFSSDPAATRRDSEKLPFSNDPAATRRDSEKLPFSNDPAATRRDSEKLPFSNDPAATRRDSEKLPFSNDPAATRRDSEKLPFSNDPAATRRDSEKLPFSNDPAATRRDSEKLPFSNDPAATRRDSEKLPFSNDPAATRRDSEKLPFSNDPAATRRDSEKLPFSNDPAATRRDSEKLPFSNDPAATRRDSEKLPFSNDPAATRRDSEKLPFSNDPAATRRDSEKLPFSNDPAATRRDSEKLPFSNDPAATRRDSEKLPFSNDPAATRRDSENLPVDSDPAATSMLGKGDSQKLPVGNGILVTPQTQASKNDVEATKSPSSAQKPDDVLLGTSPWMGVDCSGVEVGSGKQARQTDRATGQEEDRTPASSPRNREMGQRSNGSQQPTASQQIIGDLQLPFNTSTPQMMFPLPPRMHPPPAPGTSTSTSLVQQQLTVCMQCPLPLPLWLVNAMSKVQSCGAHNPAPSHGLKNKKRGNRELCVCVLASLQGHPPSGCLPVIREDSLGTRPLVGSCCMHCS